MHIPWCNLWLWLLGLGFRQVIGVGASSAVDGPAPEISDHSKYIHIYIYIHTYIYI